MCLWSKIFKIEGENTTSIKLLCYVKIILGKSFWASQKLFEIRVTTNINNGIQYMSHTTTTNNLTLVFRLQRW